MSFAQTTVIWSEDFEEAGNDTYTSNQSTIPGLTNQWEYNKTNNGRLRFAAGGGFYHGGSNAATLDASPTNTYSQNSIITTIDITGYHEDLSLSFYFMHHGEENHPDDRVLMRSGTGGSYGGWAEIYNLATNKGGSGNWVYASGIDISAQLQVTDTEIQIAFGQYDNYAANNTTSDDGFTFDDISLIYTRSLTDGDYRTRNNGNWNSNNTWQVYSGGSWVNCSAGDYPGVTVGTPLVEIRNDHDVTITANVPNSIAYLTIDGGNRDSYLYFNAGVSLTVTSETYLNSNSNNDQKAILVDAGIFHTGSISANSNGNNMDAYVRISSGEVTVTGDIVLNSTGVRTYILFTGDGTLNIGGTMSGGNITSTTNGSNNNPPTSGTVNYNSNLAQDIGNYTYYNLTFSGTGSKTSSGFTVNNIMSMEGTAPTVGTVPTYSSSATLQYTGSGVQSTGVEFLSSFTGSGGIIINNSNGVNVNGDHTITSQLTMTSGNINLGANVLTLGSSTANEGVLNYTSGAIVGMFERWIANSSTATYDFPVGSGSNTNTTLLDLNSGATGGSVIVEFIASDPGSTGLPANDGLVPITSAFTDGYWTITPANGFSVADFNLTLDGSGMTSNTIDQYTRVLMRPTSGDDWTLEGTHLPGANPIVYRAGLSTLPAEYGLGAAGALPPSVTWYTLGGGGNWNDPTTWTLDGAGSLPDNPGSDVPGIQDNVVILSGATVVMDIDNALVSSLELVGDLQIGATSGHDFTIITGNGKMYLDGAASQDNFPDGVVTLFADPVLGGTVEYNGTGLNMGAPREFNNFILNLSNSTDVMVLLEDMIINGDFTLTQGEFQINDNSATTILNLTVNGSALVDANASVSVGQGNTIGSYTIQGGTMPGVGNYHNIFHQVIFSGDFTNNGSVRFTNQAAPVYNEFTSTGAATVRFTGAANNTISLFGITDFYNLVVNKGNDQTYMLELNSDNVSNFALYGPNVVGRVENSPFSAANPEVRKALWIYNGTLHLTGNINIPTLSEGNQISGNGDYPIGQNGALWIDGANVTVYSTADNTSQVPAGAVGVNTGGSNQALSLYGTFRISNGFFGTRASAGFIFWNAAAGNVIVEGGTVNVSQLRSAGGGTGTNSYIQSGGTVIVRSNIGQSGEVAGGYALFSMHLPDAVFNMSGGTLQVYGERGDGCIFINSAAGYYNITGGDLIVENRNGNNAEIASTVPFWNVTLDQNGGTATQIELIDNSIQGETILNPDLIILNNFTIKSGVTFDHNGNDVEIGSDFLIENGADYLYDAGKQNTTTINGIDNSVMAFYNRTAAATNDEQRFWNFVIDKPSDKTVTLLSGKTGTALQGNNNNLLRIDGDFFKLLSGTLDQGMHSIRMYGDTLVNYQHLTIFDPSVTDDLDPNGINDLLKMRDDGGSATIVVTADTSRFGGWKQNSDSEIIVLNTDVKIDYLEFRHGRINIQDNNLKVDFLADQTNQNADNGSCTNCFSVSDMIMVNGAASDGGLSIFIPSDGNNPDTGTPDFLFPFGIGDAPADATGTLSKYTPVTMTLSNVTESGYVTIRPVDKVLATTNPVGDILSYYWRVDFTGFTPGNEPDVSYQFTYVNDDTDGGNEAGYVPGKVLNENPFTRSSEIASNIIFSTGNPTYTSGTIIFNGNTGGGASPFVLERANYTAGEASRFTGNVEVYYTKLLGDAANMNWRTVDNWTLATDSNLPPHHSQQPAASDYPRSGDIAYVGWVPYGDPAFTNGKPHGIEIDQTEQFAELRFTKMTDISGNPVARDYEYNFQFRPTVCINPNGFMVTGAVIGEGAFWLRSTGGNQVDPDFSLVDMGAFAREDSAYMIYESTSNGFVYDNIPEEVPNLMIAGDGWGANDRDFEISTDVTVKEDFELLGDVNLVLSSGATGDFYVEGDLRIFRLDVSGNDSGGNGEIAFPNDASRTIEVLGDLELINQSALVNIRSANTPVQVSNLMVHGNIIQDNTTGGGLQLSSGTGQDYVHLTLTGEGDHSFDQNSGADAGLYTITVDKGSDQSNSFSFNGIFTLDGPTSGVGVDKALTIENGMAVINNSSIIIDLTTGDDDFNIPATGGLQVTQGQVNASGDDSGIFLDGSLIIDGGTMDMDDGAGNGNNYIEYSASGSASINISDGSLIVGSQIRGNLITTTSVLDYTQTGGMVEIGKNAAPEGSRGVLEILNNGSNFTYTGGTLTLVRQNSATPSVAALRILPTFSDVTQTIYIGNEDTPGSQTAFGINANVPLAGLTITGGLNFPTGVIEVNPLNLTGTLNINTGAELDGNGIDLILEGDFVNDGTFTPSANNTIFASGTLQSISGTGTTSFYDFEKSGSGTLNTSIPFTINNETNILEGIFDDNGNTIDVLGNVTIDGTHQSTSGLGDGLRFSGAIQQQLARTESGTSTIGIMTITNANGVVIPEGNGYNFDIDDGLQMNGGIFNIGSSAVTLGVNADITTSTSFSVSNMVQTNSSFTDNGLGKTFPAGFTGSFLYPIGEVKYTPATMDFSVAGGTTGTTTGTIYVRPANEYHPTVNDGVQGMPTQADIDNVLQYYWTLRASSFTGFSADISFEYDEADVSVTEAGYSEADYIPARILAFSNPTNLVNKYNATDVDETANEILFSAASVFTGVDENGISGDYFCGIDEAIPDNVATYTVDVDGGSVAGDSYDIDVPGGGAPSGAVVIIPNGYTLDFDVDNVTLYKTEIQNGGTLQINDTEFHRLGIVDGTGDLKIVHNGAGNPSLPAGDYGTFFSCAGGGLEYAGTGSYNILGGIPNIRNLTLSGTGDRNFPNTNVTVCEGLVVDGPNVSTYTNKRLNVDGDFVFTSGIFNFSSGGASRIIIQGDFYQNGGIFNAGVTGQYYLNGTNVYFISGTFNMGTNKVLGVFRSNIQLIGTSINSETSNILFQIVNSNNFELSGDFIGSNSFYNLTIDKNGSSFEFEFQSDVEVKNILAFTDGVINTNGNNLILGSLASISNSGDGRYVNGRVVKTLSAAGDDFVFPIGGPTRYRPAYVQNVSVGGLDWEAEYIQASPATDPDVSSLTSSDASILTMSTEEYWRITDGQPAGSATATVGLSWGNDSYVSANSAEREQLRVMVWNSTNSNWDNAGGANYSGGHTEDFGMFNTNSTISFSEKIFTLGSTDLSNPLPVELVSFTGKETDGRVLLNWETASELNNDYFVIEHSLDGKSFSEIGVVEGAGTSHVSQLYNYTHRNPGYPDNYYRLKQIDFDGVYEYSDAILVRMDKVFEPEDIDFDMYPNPTSDNIVTVRLTSINYSKPLVVEVVNLSGRLLFSHEYGSTDLQSEFTLDLGYGVPQGIYLVRLIQPGSSIVKKLVLK